MSTLDGLVFFYKISPTGGCKIKVDLGGNAVDFFEKML